MSLIDHIVTILDHPECFGIPFEKYPDWDQGREPIPVAAQDVVLDIAGQMAALEAARENLYPVPPLVI